MKVKFTQLLNPRDERLPKKTGIGGRIKFTSPGPLFNPRISISTNSALKKMLAFSSVTSGRSIRAKNMEMLNRATDTINRHLQTSQKHRGIRFSVDKDANKLMVSIRNVQTGEVVKTLPGESAMKIAGNLRLLSGALMSGEG